MRHAQQFQALGQQVRQAWREHDFNELEFPRIAAESAAGFELAYEFDAIETADFLSQTGIQQQPTNTFSNLPITVYRDENFYIELLVWTQATTEIHEHAFSGAFKVMQGSSLHTRYRFTCEEKITLNFLTGKLEALGSEQLKAGDIRSIHPGSDGLIHSLYHLNNPSVTLVIRTPGLSAYQPQHTYQLPNLCFNSRFFTRDDRVLMLQKLLDVTAQTDRNQIAAVWLDHVEKLDFARLVWMLFTHCDTLETSDFWPELKAQIQQHHGQRTDLILEAMTERRRVLDLINARAVVNDPDLRYFLALLMNVRERDMLLQQLADRYPDTSPLDKCAELLARLSTGKTDAARMLAALASQTRSGPSNLGRLLETAIPNEIYSNRDRIRLYRQLLNSDLSSNSLNLLQDAFPDSSPAALQEFIKRMQEMPHLSQLVRSSSPP